MSKIALETVPPLTLLVIQLVCSNALLWTIVGLRRLALPSYQQAIKFALPGLIQPGLSFSLGIVGLSLTTVSIESLIWSTETIMIIGLAWLLLGEQVSIGLIIVSAVTFTGMVLVTVDVATAASSNASPVGNLLIFISTFCAALYTVLMRQRVAKLSPLLLVTLNQAVGLAGVFVVWLVSWRWLGTDIASIGVGTWLLAAVSGIALHALPFWLHTIVLERMPASLASLFLTLIPVFSLSGARMFLREELSSAQWVGAGLILVAMVCASLLYAKE